MRIVICNWTRRKVGGVEDYLTSIIPKLAHYGYDLALLSEVDTPAERSALELPVDAPDWCAARSSVPKVLASLRDWKPDLLYCHGPLNTALETQLLKLAPAIYFAHNYHGTCIGGYKAHRFPTPMPCDRKLGLPCLANYLPRRCGGLNPLTMFRLYHRERTRLQSLKRYQAVVTHSTHMTRELLKHGIAANRLFNFIPSQSESAAVTPAGLTNITFPELSRPSHPCRPKQLLFLGRMEALKGGEALIKAAAFVQQQLGKPVQVTFTGDGPERNSWQSLSSRTTERYPSLTFHFPGWLNPEQASGLLSTSDVLVVPSFWPEPFGRVGVEAGHHGLPAAAFAVGGIPDWLQNGVNGFLAPADPPTTGGLATAILRCLDENLAPGLRAGARLLANRFSTQLHFEHLLIAFEFALANGC